MLGAGDCPQLSGRDLHVMLDVKINKLSMYSILNYGVLCIYYTVLNNVNVKHINTATIFLLSSSILVSFHSLTLSVGEAEVFGLGSCV